MPAKPLFTKPTKRQIGEQLRWLEKNRCKVPRHSEFGHDHQAAIAAQITVLKGDDYGPMGENEIHQRWDDGKAEDIPDSPGNVLDAALEVRRWLDGEEEHAPSKNWKPLLTK